MVDLYVSRRREVRAARQFFARVLDAYGESADLMTDRAPALRAVIDELMPAAFHSTERYANNRIEADHGRLTACLRPMRGLRVDRTARVMRGHGLMRNVRRGHYELGVDADLYRRVTAAFAELARII